MTGFSQPERRGLERTQTVAPGSHPDADLLAAFSEHSLTAREQEQVLAHLAVCGTCRDVVALAGSQLVEPVPEELRKRGLWEVPLFHWGAAAATAIIVVFAIALGLRDYRVAAPKTAATATFNEVPPPAPVTAPETATVDKVAGQSKAKASEGIVAGVPSGQVTPSGPAAQAAPTRAKHLQEQFRYERPADESQNEPQNLDAAAKKDAGVAADAIRGRQAQPLESPQSTTESNLRDQNATAGFSNYAAKVITQQAAKQAPAAPPQKMPRSAPDDAMVAGASPQVQASTAEIGSGGMAARAALAKAPSGGPVRIATKGQLQRADASGVWANILPGHHFRTLAAIGSRIWAGGDNGVLYLSTDSGSSWIAISVHDRDTRVNGNITQLNFSDAQNGTLSTSAAETWATSDGGQTWHKQ